jgi:hypothetical protein
MTWARMRTLYGKTEARMISKFVSEIDNKYLDIIEEKPFKPYNNGDSFGYRNDQKEYFSYAKGPKKPSLDSVLNTYNIKRGSSVSVDDTVYKKGDRVKQKKFGEGMRRSVLSKDGDYQLEISFDNIGTRTLMASFAKLTKL